MSEIKTVKDLKEALEECNDSDLILVRSPEPGKEFEVPSKSSALVYFSKDLRCYVEDTGRGFPKDAVLLRAVIL